MLFSKTPSKTLSKRSRNVSSLASKLKIFKFIDCGKRIAAIAKRFEVNQFTVKMIGNNASKLVRDR